jgi:hypothetical protein
MVVGEGVAQNPLVGDLESGHGHRHFPLEIITLLPAKGKTQAGVIRQQRNEKIEVTVRPTGSVQGKHRKGQIPP